MIPLWMFPLSTGCGNTMLLKPSERVPGTAIYLFIYLFTYVKYITSDTLHVTLSCYFILYSTHIIYTIYVFIHVKYKLSNVYHRGVGAAMIIAKLAQQAGLPDGVLNIVHGAHDTVNYICDSKIIRAISFVGSDVAGKYIFERGTKNGKRVQANLGAKNHATIMPDADKDSTLNAILG